MLLGGGRCDRWGVLGMHPGEAGVQTRSSLEEPAPQRQGRCASLRDLRPLTPLACERADHAVVGPPESQASSRSLGVILSRAGDAAGREAPREPLQGPPGGPHALAGHPSDTWSGASRRDAIVARSGRMAGARQPTPETRPPRGPPAPSGAIGRRGCAAAPFALRSQARLTGSLPPHTAAPRRSVTVPTRARCNVGARQLTSESLTPGAGFELAG